MIFLILLILATFPCINAFPQSVNLFDRQVIDSTTVNNWPSVSDQSALSSDGKYFMYAIDNHPPGVSTLIIRSVRDTWEKKYILKNGYSGGFFSGDNQTAIFRDNDTLRMVTLTLKTSELAIPVRYHKRPNNGKGEWLAFEHKSQPNTLVLRNLLKGNELRFDSITDCSFGNRGKILLLQRQTLKSNTLEWLDLRNGRRTVIWSSPKDKIVSLTLDESHDQIAFIVSQSNNKDFANTLWYFNTRMAKAIPKVNKGKAGLPPNLGISSHSPKFSGSGRYIFFYLSRPLPDNADRTAKAASQLMVDIWSYKDRSLRFPEVASDAWSYLPKTQFTAMVNTESNYAACLEKDDEYISAFPDEQGEFVVVAKTSTTNPGDQYWRTEPVRYYLRSLRDSTMKLFAKGVHGGLFPNLIEILFSPKGDYLLYYDVLRSHYFSYHISSGQTRNISQTIPVNITSDKSDTPMLGGTLLRGHYPIGIAGWMQDGAVLVYDYYDIWKIDLSGRQSPINITRGYGRHRRIQLRIAFERDQMKYRIHSLNEDMLLTAFNRDNKYRGFCRLSLRTAKSPELLSLGPWHFSLFKKENIGIYLVKRESPTQASNYFWTDNFRQYHSLTDLQPQQKFNWMQVELVNFTLLDGSLQQGILYKPEIFDPNKKYPLIITYYETQSDELFWYQQPAFVSGGLGPAWFVSRGYLLLKIDIHPKPGEIGTSAYNAIMSAVQHISKMCWIDPDRIGLQGHSFGGFETYYLVTHTHHFAAAVAGAGVGNFISGYGGLQLGSRTGSESSEAGQFRMMNTLWDRPDLYIKNSAIFKATQVTTPLLIMHNRKDPIVPWSQGLEFFNGLRRLNKKVWMLQYDEGGHGLNDKDALDYTIRITQFFDHYLKGSPPPVWMTKGIPPERKGKEAGLNFDRSGNEPD